MIINEKALEAKDLEKVSGGNNDFSNNHGAKVENPFVGKEYIVCYIRTWFKGTYAGLGKFNSPAYNCYRFKQVVFDDGETISSSSAFIDCTTIYELNS